MKIIFTIVFALCASTCFAHGGWKPCVQPSSIRSSTLPAGGCACTTNTDSHDLCNPKSILPVDTLLYSTTSKARLFRTFPRLHTTLCANS